jgi:hypothetical protein
MYAISVKGQSRTPGYILASDKEAAAILLGIACVGRVDCELVEVSEDFARNVIQASSVYPGLVIYNIKKAHEYGSRLRAEIESCSYQQDEIPRRVEIAPAKEGGFQMKSVERVAYPATAGFSLAGSFHFLWMFSSGFGEVNLPESLFSLVCAVALLGITVVASHKSFALKWCEEDASSEDPFMDAYDEVFGPVFEENLTTELRRVDFWQGSPNRDSLLLETFLRALAETVITTFNEAFNHAVAKTGETPAKREFYSKMHEYYFEIARKVTCFAHPLVADSPDPGASLDNDCRKGAEL